MYYKTRSIVSELKSIVGTVLLIAELVTITIVILLAHTTDPLLVIIYAGVSLFLAIFLPGYLLLSAAGNISLNIGEFLIISFSVSIALLVLASTIFSVLPIWSRDGSLIVLVSINMLCLIVYSVQLRRTTKTTEQLVQYSRADFLSLFLILSASLIVVSIMVLNLLSYSYYNASDPWVNQIYFREIVSGKFNLYASRIFDPYVKTASERGFHFFLTYFSVVSGISIHQITRFGGPASFLLFSTSVSLATYRMSGQSKLAGIIPFVLAVSSYTVYRFLMLVPEQFGFIIFGAFFIISIKREAWASLSTTIIGAILLAALSQTHILLFSFAILTVVMTSVIGFFQTNFSGFIRYYNVLVLGILISPRFPSLLLGTSLYELVYSYRLPLKPFLDAWQYLYSEHIFQLDIIMHIVTLCLLLLVAAIKNVRFSRALRRASHLLTDNKHLLSKLLVLLFSGIFIVDAIYQFRLSETGMYSEIMDISDFNVVSLILCVLGGLYCLHERRSQNPWVLVPFGVLVTAFLIQLLLFSVPLYSTRFPIIIYTNRLIPYASIIVSLFSILGICYLNTLIRKVNLRINLGRMKSFIRGSRIKILVESLLCIYLMFSSIQVVFNTRGWSRWYQNDIDAALYLKSIILPIKNESVILPQWDDQLLLSYVGVPSDLYVFNKSFLTRVFSAQTIPEFISLVRAYYPDKKVAFVFETENWRAIIGNINLPKILSCWRINTFNDANIYMINLTYPTDFGKVSIDTIPQGYNVSLMDINGQCKEELDPMVDNLDMGICWSEKIFREIFTISNIGSNDSIVKIMIYIPSNIRDHDNDSLPDIKLVFLSKNSTSYSTPYDRTIYWDYNDTNDHVSVDATTSKIIFVSGLTLFNFTKNAFIGYNIYPVTRCDYNGTVRTISGYYSDERFNYYTYIRSDVGLKRLAFTLYLPTGQQARILLIAKLQ